MYGSGRNVSENALYDSRKKVLFYSLQNTENTSKKLFYNRFQLGTLLFDQVILSMFGSR